MLVPASLGARVHSLSLNPQQSKMENHYRFCNLDAFKRLEKRGEILEKNFYNGHWYGSSKSEIDNALKVGRNVLKEIEVNGGMNYKKLYPNAVLIFIKADLKDIKNRLTKRGQNTPDEIEKRLKTANDEMGYEKEYHYSVTNPEGHPEQAIEEVEKITRKELNE